MKGKCQINIYNSVLEHGKVNKKKIYTEENCTKGKFEKLIEIKEIEKYLGCLYFEIISLDEAVIIENCEYKTKQDMDTLNDVDLKIVICTYKREEYVRKNIKLLENIFYDDASNLHNNFEVYIIDNAKTIKKYESEFIHFIYNKNLGGSGGFTRGLIEVMNSHKMFSNVLLMDDDVEILPESLKRLYSLLLFLKEEYKDSIVSGSMLQMDKKYLLHETGGNFIGRGFEPIKYKLDMTQETNILFNEQDTKIKPNFAPWWFSCIPSIYVKRDNLPLPFFIKGDDVEYGIRNTKKIISLNGIGIWHESFEKKYAQANTFYYEVRNFLIITAVNYEKYNSIKAIKFIIERYMREALRYRYKSTDLIMNAVEDFLRGSKFFFDVNEEEKHKSILNKCYEFKNIYDFEHDINFEKIKEQCFLAENENNKNKILPRILTLNGYLMPKFLSNSSNYKIVNVNKSKHINYYKNSKILNVLIEEKKAFITEKDTMKFIKNSIKIFFITFKVLIKYNSVKNDYKINITKLQNEDYWKKKF